MAKERSIPGTHEDFTSLLAALGNSPAAAGQHYEQLRAKLIFFFTRKALEIPEDLADEVLDRLGHRLSEGLAILSVDAFALEVARHVAQEQAAMSHQVQAVGVIGVHGQSLLAADLRIEVLPGAQMAQAGLVKCRRAARFDSLRFPAGGPALLTIHLRIPR